MSIRCLVMILTFVLGLCVPSYGEQRDDGDLKGILEAVVKVRATVPQNARTARSLGTEREGSGTVIDSQGLILTIGYLILEADRIEVVSSKGKVVGATFVAYDHSSGFGLLRANEPFAVTPMELGESADVYVGDQLLVASHRGPESVVLATVISRQEFAGYWEYLLDDAIYTVPSYPNYGGAALIGSDGSLLGIGSILTQFAMQGVGFVSSNMFVPIDYLKPILSDLIVKGRSSGPGKPWLGFHAEEIRGRVFVIRVLPDGPAEKVGLKEGDIVLKVNSKPVEGLADFYRKVWSVGGVGVKVPLSVLQGSEVLDITIHSGDRYKYLHLYPSNKMARR